MLEYRRYTGPQEAGKALDILHGILTGILMDGDVNGMEFNEVEMWMHQHEHLSEKQPFHSVYTALREALSDGILEREQIEDLLWLSEGKKWSSFDLEISRDIRQLHGILHGILSDGIVKEEEVKQLSHWISEHSHLNGYYPYDEIKGVLYHILADGRMDEDEDRMLKAIFMQFVELSNTEVSNLILDEVGETYDFKGICATNPSLTFKDKVYCLTGVFSVGTKKEVGDAIKALEGKISNNLTKSVQYLIVGTDGNPCWQYSNYGRKVEKAMQYRKAGQQIQIVSEQDFWSFVNECATD